MTEPRERLKIDPQEYVVFANKPRTIKPLSANPSSSETPFARHAPPEPAKNVNTEYWKENWRNLLEVLKHSPITWASVPPLGTFCTIATCVAGLAVSHWLKWNEMCLSSHLLMDSHFSWLQVYRVVTYALFHTAVLHVSLNVAVLAIAGWSLELLQGTCQFLNTIALLWLWNGVILPIASWTAAHNPILRYPLENTKCHVGMSGLVLGLLVIDTWHNHPETRRLFGRYDVSSIYFSLALLFLFAFVMPHNLLEFAVGILGGWAYLYGLFRWVILSLRTVTLLEGTWVMECVTRQRMFVFYSGSEPWEQRAEWPLGQVRAAAHARDDLATDAAACSPGGVEWDDVEQRMQQSKGGAAQVDTSLVLGLRNKEGADNVHRAQAYRLMNFAGGTT